MSDTLTDEHKFGVFENRLLWRAFAPKGKEISGEWTKERK
jgi:hypothetical protein